MWLLKGSSKDVTESRSRRCCPKNAGEVGKIFTDTHTKTHARTNSSECSVSIQFWLTAPGPPWVRAFFFQITRGEEGKVSVLFIFYFFTGSGWQADHHIVMHGSSSSNVTNCLRFWLSQEAARLSWDRNAVRTQNLIVERKSVYPRKQQKPSNKTILSHYICSDHPAKVPSVIDACQTRMFSSQRWAGLEGVHITLDMRLLMTLSYCHAKD